MAAIASVALAGPEAKAILGRIFSKGVPCCGHSVFGAIRDGGAVLDSVVMGCEGPEYYVIHCHGNPLLAERIVRLCEDAGAVLRRSEDFLLTQMQAECVSLLEAEARLEMTRAATFEGVELIARQISGGLTAWATQWINDNSIDLNHLKKECLEIIERYDIAVRIIHGIKIALVGPPNSGKSTLLNWLAGDNAALVSDTAGTTRDWVSTVCRIGPLRAEVIDTAGMDRVLAESSELDRAAQESALEVIQDCDMVLNIQDCTKRETGGGAVFGLKPVLTVYAKSDKLADAGGYSPDCRTGWVLVSAATNRGLETLCKTIVSVLGADSIRAEQPVCFNKRQVGCLGNIVRAQSHNIVYKELKSILG